MNKYRHYLIPLITLIIIGGFMYAFNLHNGLFWDDEDWIMYNPAVHNFSVANLTYIFKNNTLTAVGLTSNYYRPVLFLTFLFNYAADGIQPLWYHVVSNSLHLANGVLVFFLLYALFKRRLVAWIGALMFLIHPVQTEAVAYISGRGDPLHLFFMLCALLLFVRSEQSVKSWRSWPRVLSILILMFALLSHEKSIIFPFLIVIVSIIMQLSAMRWSGFMRIVWRAFMKALPYFATVLLYGILRLTVLNFANTLDFYNTENIYSSHLSVRLYTFLHALLVYFRLLFVPTGLHMEREVDIHTSFFQWPVWASALILVGFVGLLVYFYRRRSSVFPLWFFSLGWFFISLGPVSGITPINAQLYEHWLYVGLIGPTALAGWYVVRLLDCLHSRKVFYGCVCAGLIAYGSFFSVQSIRRNIIWGKPIEFYKDILKYDPTSVRIHNNLGNTYFNMGDNDNAEAEYWKAVAIEDIFPQPHYNLAGILESKGDAYGAIKEYQKAIEIGPTYYYALQGLASLYAKQGDLKKAAETVEQLKKLRPSDARVFLGAGLIYEALHNYNLALQNARDGLSYAESDAKTKSELEALVVRLKK